MSLMREPYCAVSLYREPRRLFVVDPVFSPDICAVTTSADGVRVYVSDDESFSAYHLGHSVVNEMRLLLTC